MKRRVAHVMRRTARVLITRANKLDPPQMCVLVSKGAGGGGGGHAAATTFIRGLQ